MNKFIGVFLFSGVIFSNLVASDTSVINPIANDEVVTLEEVYKAYCSTSEFKALAKKVRDGASFIPFVEKDLLEDGYKYVESEMDFKDIVIDKDSTKEEIQEEIDKYKRNVKLHRVHLLDFIESLRYYPDTRFKFDEYNMNGYGLYLPNKGKTNFYKLIGGYTASKRKYEEEKSDVDYFQENCLKENLYKGRYP